MSLGAPGSGEQAEFLAELYCLCSPLGTQFVEGAAAVGFDGVLGNEELCGDFAVAHAFGYQFQNFKLAPGDVEFFALLLVGQERVGCYERVNGSAGNGVRFRCDSWPPPCEPLAKPDSESGKDGRDEADVDFDGMFDYEELVLGPLQHGDQDSADYAVDQYVPLHRFRE